MKRQLLCAFLVVVGMLMIPNPSQPQSTSGDTNVLVALVCGGPAPILGQLTSLTINGVVIFTGGASCSDTSRVTSVEPHATDSGTPGTGPCAVESGVPVREICVASVSATVSVSAGPFATPVTCAGSQSALPLMITCDDIANHLHLHVIVR